MKHNTRKNNKNPKNKKQNKTKNNDFYLIQKIPKNRLMYILIKTQQIQYI
jgi:hypothetical protein